MLKEGTEEMRGAPARLLTRTDEAVEDRCDPVLQGILDTADFAGQEALLTVRGQFAMAENVQEVKISFQERCQ